MDTYVCQYVTLTLTILVTSTSALTGKVLLVSFDGFRWDYLNIVDGLVNFPKFAADGSSAPYMNNTFTTLTFATHYSMATGLYQESHGMVSNYMYDPVFKENFYPGCKTGNDQKWWGGEPIWITATLQGKKVGCIFWAGTEVAFNGVKPELVLKYDSSMPFEQRMDAVLDWFKYDDLDLGLVYIHEPDKAGHKHGPRSTEVADQVRNVDRVLGYMMEGIRDRELKSLLNVIVVSDHGVTNISLDRMVVIPDIIDFQFVEIFVENGAMCHVFVKEGHLDTIFEGLRSAHPKMAAYQRADVPEYWHYSHNRRIGDIVLVMDEGWSCTENLAAQWNSARGSHGYDNRLMSMKPIFMAQGPDIKGGHTVEPFMSLDIYPLTAALLDIQPAPNNGTLNIVKDILVVQTSPKILRVMSGGSTRWRTQTTQLAAILGLIWCL